MKQNLNTVRDKSGSCAIVMIVIDENVWIANTGDSRAVLSKNIGEQYISLTNDHKPSEDAEKERIMKGGGSVYQNNNILLSGPGGPTTQGPVRVMPGRLSVSRTFGDCQAKMEKYGGNPNVVICDPEIHHLTIDADDNDFLLLACDGVFDRLSTEFSCQEIWNAQMHELLSFDKKSQNTPTRSKRPDQPFSEAQFHQACGFGVDHLLMKSMKAQSLDNLSVVMIGLKGLRKALEQAYNLRFHHTAAQQLHANSSQLSPKTKGKAYTNPKKNEINNQSGEVGGAYTGLHSRSRKSFVNTHDMQKQGSNEAK